MKKLVLVLLMLVLILIISQGRILSKTVIKDNSEGFIIITAIAGGDQEAVKDFVKFKEEQGFNIRVEKVEEIEKISEGSDLSEKIRNWLIKHTKEEDKYLLLIGDPLGEYTWSSTGGKLPMRIAYPISKEWDYKVPTDYYYADLKGNWDANNDGRYGGTEDEISWKPDLYVGRIPFSDSKQIRFILKNIIEMEKNTEEKQKSALLSMPVIFREGESEFDTSYLGEELRKILEPVFQVTTLYEKEGLYISPFLSIPLNTENFVNNVNDKDLIIARYQTRTVWLSDDNKNGIVDTSEIKKELYFDSSINLTTPTKIFGLFGAFGADPFWDSNFTRLLLSGQLVCFIGNTGLSIADKNQNKYEERIIYEFVKNIIIKESVGEALFDVFDQWIVNDKYDQYNFLSLVLSGDPSLKLEFLPPQIEVEPKYLDFGFDKNLLQIQIKNTGEKDLVWKIESSPPWIKLEKTTGTVEGKSNETIKVSIDHSKMITGENIGNIDIDSNAGKAEILVKAIKDDIPPEIILFLSDEVYEPRIEITGSVKDKDSGIKTVILNKKAISLSENLTFREILYLKEGVNTITLEVEDNAGNKAEKTLSVKYIKRTILKLQIGNKTMYVNDTPQGIDIPPIIIEGRTLLPIRWVAEPLGAAVGWDGNERKVTVTLKNTKIELWIGKNIARVNGVDTPIDPDNPKVVPIIINGRTMLPVRFVAENLGCKVDWDPDTKTVTITYPKD